MEQKPRSRRAVVIGQEMADAQKKEQKRMRQGDAGASPLLQETYPFRSEELDLLNPLRSDLDDRLRDVCAQFRELSADQRTSFRKRVCMDEFYTLLAFARRASVFALREQSTEILEDGLLAITMIEAERTDFRDILGALSLLYHIAARIRVGPDRAFDDAAKLAEPRVAELMAGFIRRPAAEKDIAKAWGFREVETTMGIGFVHSDFSPYNPKVDLLDAAIRIAAVIGQDKYDAQTITVASKLPDVWLKETGALDLEDLLGDIQACVTINSKLRKKYHPSAESQQFTVFLAELNQTASAKRLSRLAGSVQPESHCMLGVSSGQLFCLVVARSFVSGMTSFETGDSLARFEPPIREVLALYPTSIASPLPKEAIGYGSRLLIFSGLAVLGFITWVSCSSLIVVPTIHMLVGGRWTGDFWSEIFPALLMLAISGGGLFGIFKLYRLLRA